MAAGLTLDSGALIAADKGDRSIWKRCKEAVERGAPVTVPAAVLAQVWRGNSPAVSMLLGGCAIEALDEQSAKRTGELLAKSRTSDVIDAVVVLGAVTRGDAILTSDPDDIRHLVRAARSKILVITL